MGQELPDQAALAMEVDCIAVTRLQAIDAHRRAAARLLGEVARLAPLQGLVSGPTPAVRCAVSSSSSRSAISLARTAGG